MVRSDALTSWKEIAAYLGKTVRTVQRWETALALPIRRPQQKARNIVIALPEELDEWIQQKLQPRSITDQQAASPARRTMVMPR